MPRTAIFLAAVAVLFAADNPWNNVKIDRVDARAGTTKGKMNVESTAKETAPDPKPQPYGATAVPGTSYSSKVSSAGKQEFETIYRRPAAPANH